MGSNLHQETKEEMILLHKLQQYWDNLNTSHKAIVVVLSITILPLGLLYTYLTVNEYIVLLMNIL